jgi:hypothetical protein
VLSLPKEDVIIALSLLKEVSNHCTPHDTATDLAAITPSDLRHEVMTSHMIAYVVPAIEPTEDRQLTGEEYCLCSQKLGLFKIENIILKYFLVIWQSSGLFDNCIAIFL